MAEGVAKPVDTHVTGICALCAARHEFPTSPFLNAGRHAHASFDGLTILSCKSCGSSWTADPPSSAQLGEYYSAHYGLAKLDFETMEKNFPQADSRPFSLISLGRLFTEFEPSDIFLDIGPGMGTALAAATLMLPRPRLAAIEFNPRTVEVFQRKLGAIDVAQSARELIKLYGPNSVRFIYSAHCFEHFAPHDLSETLTDLYELLAPKGVMAVEVPAAALAHFRKIRGHTPHLIFFSPKGLTGILRQAQFEIPLCISVLGKGKGGNDYVAQNLSESSNLREDFVQAAKAFNGGDWIRSGKGLVIKCIARKG